MTVHVILQYSFQDINPSIILPGQHIIVMARADKSGTTEAFTNGLTSFRLIGKLIYQDAITPCYLHTFGVFLYVR